MKFPASRAFPTIFPTAGVGSFRNFLERSCRVFSGKTVLDVGAVSAMLPTIAGDFEPSHQVPTEVNVLRTLDDIDQLADRIERAYRRRNPRWSGLGSDRAVWGAAASSLMEASTSISRLPVDPELFVAVLAPGGISPDPWCELTAPKARFRYLKVVRQIIGRLRRELEAELKLAESQLAGGMDLDDLQAEGNDRISALTLYILAFRAARFDLVLRQRTSAAAQHASCPLYRQASRMLLPGHAFPGSDREVEWRLDDRVSLQFSVN